MAQSINIWAATGENANLSNFAIRPFEMRTGDSFTEFQSVEQAFQFSKIAYSSVRNTEEGDRLRQEILSTTDGAELRRISRSIPDLNVAEWDKVSPKIMETFIRQSFLSNEDALNELLATGNASFTHNQDNSRWKHEFPRILARVRDSIRYERAESNLLKTDPADVERFNVVTLGIGKADQESFFALIPDNVDVVIDARNSMNGFRSERWRDSAEMKARFERAGKQYVTVPAFSGKTRDTDAMIDGDPKRINYSVIEQQDDYKTAIDGVKALVEKEKGKRVLIIGSESNPAFSARALSVGQVLERDNISVGHISAKNGTVSVRTQEEVISAALGHKRRIARGDYTQVHFNSDRSYTVDAGCVIADRQNGQSAEERLLSEVGNYGRRVSFIKDDGVRDDGHVPPREAMDSAHRKAAETSDFTLIIATDHNDVSIRATQAATSARNRAVITIPSHKEDLYDEDRINRVVNDITRKIGFSLAAKFANPLADVDVNNLNLNVAGSHIARIANSFVPSLDEQDNKGVKEGFHVDDLSGITQEDVDHYCREIITRLTTPDRHFEFEDRAYPWKITSITTTGQTGVEESAVLAAQQNPHLTATVVEPAGDWLTLDNETLRGLAVSDAAAFRNRFNLGLKKEEVTDAALTEQIELQEFKRVMADNGMATGLTDRQLLALRLCGISNNDLNIIYEQSRRVFENADGEAVGQSYNTPDEIMDLITYCAGYGVETSGAVDEATIKEKLAEASRITDDLRKMGVSYVTVSSPDYPASLRDMPETTGIEYRVETVRTEQGEAVTETVPYEVKESRPAILFYTGTLDALQNPGIALTGNRTVDGDDVIKTARAAANILTEEDVSVVANMNEAAPRSALIEQMEHGGVPVAVTDKPLGGVVSYDAKGSRLTETQLLALHYAGYPDTAITALEALSNEVITLPDGSVKQGTYDNAKELMQLLDYARTEKGIEMPDGFRAREIDEEEKHLQTIKGTEGADEEIQRTTNRLRDLVKEKNAFLKRNLSEAGHDIRQAHRQDADNPEVDEQQLAKDIAHKGGVTISENAQGVPEKKSRPRTIACAIKGTTMVLDGALSFGSGELLGGLIGTALVLPFASVRDGVDLGKDIRTRLKRIDGTAADVKEAAAEAVNEWEKDDEIGLDKKAQLRLSEKKNAEAKFFSYDEDDVHQTPTRCPVHVIRYGDDLIFLVSEKDKDIRQAVMDRYGDSLPAGQSIRFADPKMEGRILERLRDGAIEVEGQFVNTGTPYIGTQPLKEEPRVSTIYYMNGKTYSLLDAPNGTIGLLSLDKRQANAELFGRLSEAAVDIQKKFLGDCGLDPNTPMRFEKADYLVVNSSAIEVRRGDAVRARIWMAEDGSLRARNFAYLGDDLEEHRGHTAHVFSDPAKVSDPSFFEQFKTDLSNVINDYATLEDQKWALADRAQLGEMVDQKEKGFSDIRPANIDVAMQDIADAVHNGVLPPESAAKADLGEVFVRLERSIENINKDIKATEREIRLKEKELSGLDAADDNGRILAEEELTGLRDKRIETIARRRLLELYKMDVALAGSAKEIVNDNKSRVIFLGGKGTRIELSDITVEEGETKAAYKEMKHLSDAHAGNKVPERYRNDIIKDIEKAEKNREERSESRALASEVKGEPSNGVFIIERDGRQAYADRSLNIISGMYPSLSPMQSFGIATNEAGQKMFIRPDGSELLKDWVDDIFRPGDGAAVIGKKGADGKEFNLLDLTSGKLVSEQWSPYMGAMEDGWAPFKARACDGEENKGKWNYINKKGELLLTTGWVNSATKFKNGQATVTKGGVECTINKFGRILSTKDLTIAGKDKNISQSKGSGLSIKKD